MQTETVGPQIHCCKHCLPLSKRTFDKNLHRHHTQACEMQAATIETDYYMLMTKPRGLAQVSLADTRRSRHG
ncbi:hypothetical protein CPter91_2305 [Collimonas pratensis]|uniref:Uncharacterized protein n=1 Tax=Collimonas pratensis TaxID=279113 RepID=A0A127Q3L2_9BURK|nr:hypothetical protein CPter91_2305 [Collimonas pratensis]